MSTIEEMSLWTVDDVMVQVRLLLPSGWEVTQGREGSFFVSTLSDSSGTVQWDRYNTDLRLLLLDAYGWLLLRNSRPANPSWSREKEITPKTVQGEVGLEGVPVPDPEDLDPKEIQAILAGRRGKR